MILFFDTETTGLPKNRNSPSTDTDNWPRVVQLAWILTDFDGNQISEKCFIIKPEGYEISRGATNIHGFTTQYALENGHSMLDVLEDFADDVKKAEMIVAHNLDFDKNVISAEFHRCGYRDLIDNLHGICTMKDSTEFCALHGNKWPSLFELHLKLFGQDFKGAHDALSDIRATSKCFWELNRLGVIIFQSTNQIEDEAITIDQDELTKENVELFDVHNMEHLDSNQVDKSSKVKYHQQDLDRVNRLSYVSYTKIDWQVDFSPGTDELESKIDKTYENHNKNVKKQKNIVAYLLAFLSSFLVYSLPYSIVTWLLIVSLNYMIFNRDDSDTNAYIFVIVYFSFLIYFFVKFDPDKN